MFAVPLFCDGECTRVLPAMIPLAPETAATATENGGSVVVEEVDVDFALEFDVATAAAAVVAALPFSTRTEPASSPAGVGVPAVVVFGVVR